MDNDKRLFYVGIVAAIIAVFLIGVFVDAGYSPNQGVYEMKQTSEEGVVTKSVVSITNSGDVAVIKSNFDAPTPSSAKLYYDSREVTIGTKKFKALSLRRGKYYLRHNGTAFYTTKNQLDENYCWVERSVSGRKWLAVYDYDSKTADVIPISELVYERPLTCNSTDTGICLATSGFSA